MEMSSLLSAKQGGDTCSAVVTNPPIVAIGSQVVGVLLQSGNQIPELERLDDYELGSLVALAMFEAPEVTPTHLWQLPPALGHAPLQLIFVQSLLKGTVPSQLGLLHASYISIEFCAELEGTIPSQLGSVTSLVQLEFNHVAISGSVPSQLGKLTNLETLDVGFSELGGTLPSELGRLHKLTWLSFGETRVAGTVPTEFGNFRALELLWLQSTELGGSFPTQVAVLPVHTVYATGVRFTEMPHFLFPNGTRLHLASLPLAAWPAVDFAGAESLFLNDCGLTGAIPSELGLATAMTYLRAAGNRLSGAIPSQFGRLTALTTLELSENWLSAIPSQLALLGGMANLTISANRLGGTIATQFGGMSSLALFNASSNMLSGTIPSQLGALTRLTMLDLSNNVLFGTIPSQLGLLTRLTHVGLADNALTGTIPAQLLALGELTSATVARNQLEGTLHGAGRSRSAWLKACEDSGLDEHDCDYTCAECPSGTVALVACDWKGRGQWCVHWGVVGAVSGLAVVGWGALYASLAGPGMGRRQAGLRAAHAVYSTVGSVLDLLFVGGSKGAIFALAVSFLVVLWLCKFWFGVATVRSLRDPPSRQMAALLCGCAVLHVVVLKDVAQLQSHELSPRFTVTYVSIGLVEALAEGTLQLLTIAQGNTSNVVVAAFAFSVMSFCSLAALSLVLVLWHHYTSHALDKGSTRSLEMEGMGNAGAEGSDNGQHPEDQLPDVPKELNECEPMPHEDEGKAGRGDKRRRLALLFACCMCVATAWQCNDERSSTPLGPSVTVAPMVARQPPALHVRGENPSRTAVGVVPKQTTPNCDPDEFQSISGPFVCVLGQLLAIVDPLASSEDFDLEGAIPSIRCVQFMILTENPRVLPSTVGSLAHLKVLALKKVTGHIPSQLGLVTTLVFMDLDDMANETPVPSELGQLEALATLRMRESSFVSVPSQFGLLHRLTFLEFSLVLFPRSNQLPSQIGQLAQLESLLVQHWQVYGTVPSQLGNLRNLTALVITDAAIGGSLPTQLGRLTKLTRLELALNELRGDTMQWLLTLPQLSTIDVEDNVLSGALLCPSCSPSPDLRALRARNNRLSGTLPSQLGIATALSVLSVELNEGLTGPIPSQLGLLRNLTLLELAHCAFTGTLPSQLALLTSLSAVTVKHNRLRGKLPEGVDAALWLADCDYSGIDHPKCARECPDCLYTELRLIGCDGRGHGQYCLPFYVLLVAVGLFAFAMRGVLRNLVKAERSRRELIGSSLVSTVAAVHLVLDVLFVASSEGGIQIAGSITLCVVVVSRLVLVTNEFLFLESRKIVRISDELKMFAIAMLFCVVDPSTVRGLLKALEAGHKGRAEQVRRWVRRAHAIHDAPMLGLQIAASVANSGSGPSALQALIATVVSIVFTSRLWVRWHVLWSNAVRDLKARRARK